MQFQTRSCLIAAACACALAACSSLPESGPRVQAPPERSLLALAPFTAAERDFVTKVAVRTAYEIEVSKLAAERALSPAVRNYAQRVAHDDVLMNNDLAALMSAHGVAPAQGLPADKASKLQRLAALPRSDAFDNGYIRVVGIEDRRKTISMFEKARRDVRNRDLRAWIDRSLAALRTHLSNAQGIAATLTG